METMLDDELPRSRPAVLLKHPPRPQGNQPTLEAEIADYFNCTAAQELVVKAAEIEKRHGRIKMRTYAAHPM